MGSFRRIIQDLVERQDQFFITVITTCRQAILNALNKLLSCRIDVELVKHTVVTAIAITHSVNKAPSLLTPSLIP